MNNLEKKEVTAVLFLDLQKAFDTVSHDILLKKLQHYGVRGSIHKLLSSYLSGRKQFTKIQNSASDLDSVLWGVPQGSVLGPLLFLIYINDLPNASELSSWLFADDTALAMSAKNINELETRFNREVGKVQDWLLANGLSVHYVDKTQYMLFHGTTIRNIDVENFSLNMGGNQIERTVSYKYLGVTVDNKLNWKTHIKKLCSKLSSVCGVLSKVRHYLDRKSLMLIYNSLFESRLRYALLGWGTASEHYLSRIKVLQNKAVRFITFSSFRTAMAPLYSKLKILPLSKLLFHQQSIFMHSLHYKSLPFALSVYCHQPQHSYGTRYTTSKNYTLPPVSTNRGKKSIKFSGPKAWAEVSKELKEIAFRKPFAKKLKAHILTSTYVETPSESNAVYDSNEVRYRELEALFQSVDEESDFEGFNYTDLETLFQSDDDESDFEGFDSSGFGALFQSNTNKFGFVGFNFSDLEALFTSDSENEDFLGFQSDDDESDFEVFDSSGSGVLLQSDTNEFNFEGFNSSDLEALFTSDSENEDFFGF